MELIANILLVAGALGAGLYCFVLGRRLNRFNDLENGVGGAVAVLSAQVDDLSKTLLSAQATAAQSAETLTALSNRAEDISRKLELQMASLHDIPDIPAKAASRPEKAPEKAAPAPVQKPTEPMFTRHRATGDAA
jgi:hypothetical protein